MSNDRFNNYDEQVKQLVMEFEQNNMRGNTQFFDVDEYEIIIDYYLETEDLKPLATAIEHALSLYPDSTSIRMRQAQLLTAQEHFPQAIKMLVELKKSEPDNTEIDYSLGVAYSAANQPQKAINSFLKAADDGWELGIVYTNIGEEYYKMHQLDKAIEYYTRALQTDSYDDSTLYCYTEACTFGGKLNQAVDQLQQIVKQHPYNNAAWQCLGEAQAGLSLYEQAIESFEYAYAINKNTPDVGESIAFCHEQLGNIGEAASALLRTLNPDNNAEHIYLLLGELYLRHANNDMAQVYLRKALDENPDNTEALSKLAFCYYLMKDYSSAETTVKKALAINPDDADALCTAAIVNDSLGNTEKAIRYFDRMFDTDDYTEEHCRTYITFLYNNEMYDDLIDFATTLLHTFPHDPFFSTYLVASCFYTNRYNSARRHLGDAYIDFLLGLCPEIGESPHFVDLINTYADNTLPPEVGWMLEQTEGNGSDT